MLKEKIAALEREEADGSNIPLDDQFNVPSDDGDDGQPLPRIVVGSVAGSVARSDQGPRGTKRRAEEDLRQDLLKRTLKPQKLTVYAGKSIRDHLDFVRSAETSLRLTPENLPVDESKILFTMRVLVEESRESGYRHAETVHWSEVTWKEYTTFLLDFIEDSVNRQLYYVLLYHDATQCPHQSVQSFDAYLSSIEALLPPFIEK